MGYDYEINLTKAQQRMQHVNSHRRDISFHVGDLVFLRLQSYRQHSLARRRFNKLSLRFFCPYKIIRCTGPMAYELELPTSLKVHLVFHISLLRKAYGQHDVTEPSPLLISPILGT